MTFIYEKRSCIKCQGWERQGFCPAFASAVMLPWVCFTVSMGWELIWGIFTTHNNMSIWTFVLRYFLFAVEAVFQLWIKGTVRTILFSKCLTRFEILRQENRNLLHPKIYKELFLIVLHFPNVWCGPLEKFSAAEFI